MKNTVKIIAITMMIGLTSCCSNLDFYENRTPTILPNNFGESTPESYDYEESTTGLEVVSDAIPRAYDGVVLSEEVKEDIDFSAEVTEDDVQIDEESIPLNINSTCKDTIYLLDGRIFPITFLEETSMSVRYKKCDDPLNRTWSKGKNKVEKIVFSDGSQKSYYKYDHSPKNPQKTAKIVGGVILAGFLGALLIGAGFLYLLLLSIF